MTKPIVNQLSNKLRLLFALKSHYPRSDETRLALWRLIKLILDTLDFNEVVQKIVDSILTELGYLQLGYRIVVLALVDHEQQTLRRVSISQTDEAKKAVLASPVPFKEINIPLSETENYCIKTLQENKPTVTHNWYDILRPIYTPEDAVRVQSYVGIRTSMVYPVIYRGKPEGIMIFSMVKDIGEVTDQEKDLIQNLTDIIGLAVQNSRFYTTLQDTTRDLTNANTKLQELDKLKDEFVSLASHELRTPMTAIKGSLSTILEGYAGDITSQTREFLVAAYNENDRLLRLVNNLLNISRIESGRLQFRISKISYDEIIHDVIGNLEPVTKEKNLYLRYEYQGPLPQILADPDLVREILINIIGNALKFTHKGGVTIKAALKENFVETSITDTGSGIAKEDWDLLFKKFSQVRGSYSKPTGGTGLGLYICKQIVEGQGGKIWLDSTIGVGSTFYFTIPIAM